MKKTFTALLGCFGFVTAADGQILVGLDPVLDNGGADGWSGITVLETPITAPGATSPNAVVTHWNYYAERADGNHSVTPLLLENAGGTYSIIGIGTTDTASTVGIQSLGFGLTSGVNSVDTTSGNTYHAGVFQFDLVGAEDTNDGTIPFASANGLGMFQLNVPDGHTPGLTDVVTAEHASAAGPAGRLYAVNFEYIPEPGVFGLLGLGGLLLILRRRRRG